MTNETMTNKAYKSKSISARPKARLKIIWKDKTMNDL
jgi:hypothetical protein